MPEAQSPRVIRVVTANDPAVVRRGLRQLLDAEEGFEVVAEASDLDGARRYVLGHCPDVLVLGLNLPGGLSLGSISELRAKFLGTQIVVLKEAADSELVEAIRRAASGDTYLKPRLGALVAAGPPPGLPDGPLRAGG